MVTQTVIGIRLSKFFYSQDMTIRAAKRLYGLGNMPFPTQKKLSDSIAYWVSQL